MNSIIQVTVSQIILLLWLGVVHSDHRNAMIKQLLNILQLAALIPYVRWSVMLSLHPYTVFTPNSQSSLSPKSQIISPPSPCGLCVRLISQFLPFFLTRCLVAWEYFWQSLCLMTWLHSIYIYWDMITVWLWLKKESETR